MRCFRLAPLAAVAVFGFASVASAQAPVYSWTGFYVGGNAGYLWSGSNFVATSTPGPCDPASGTGCTATPNYSSLSATAATFSQSLNNRGFIGGVQLGYNWHINPTWVAGIEADIQGLGKNKASLSFNTVVPSPPFPGFPLTQAATISRSIDFLGTVRGRLGFLSTPAMLVYATGGLAYGGVKASASLVQSCVGCSFTGIPNTSGEQSSTLFGWTVGAGLEWKFAPKWSAKAEYLYYDLGKQNFTLPTLQGFNGGGGPLFMSSTTTISNHFNGSIARVGINFQLN